MSKPGDVWIMGSHRLLCGDATDPANCDTLLGNERVAMIFQDQPYNVDYANSPKDTLRSTHRPILNGNLGEDFEPFPQGRLNGCPFVHSLWLVKSGALPW